MNTATKPAANNAAPHDLMPNFTFMNKRDISALLGVVAPVLFIVIIGMLFNEFVMHAIEANLAINLGIIGAASFGVYLIVARLLAAQEDFRIILRFGYEAKQGIHMKALLNQAWLKNRYVRHYLGHIAATGGTLASHMEQSAIENELHALQVDYESRMELPQFLVGFMIAMGLLGTFIGLLSTLTGISGMLDGMGGEGDVQQQFMKLVVELRKPLNGMGIAFSASMFGLITSLMLSIMMTNLRRFISRVISLARNVMHELTEMAHERTGPVYAGSLSPQDINTLLESGEAGEAALTSGYSGGGIMSGGRGLNSAMSGRFDVMTKKLEILIETLAANTEGTRKTNDLLGFGPRMRELSEKTLEEIKTISIYGAEHNKVLQSLTASHADTARTLSGLLDFQRQTSAEQQRVLQTLAANNADTVRILSGLLDFQRQTSADFLEQARRLSSQITDMREVEIGSGRHLNDIKESFTKLCKSTEMIDLIAASIGSNSALLETLVEETRQSQYALTAINNHLVERKE